MRKFVFLISIVLAVWSADALIACGDSAGNFGYVLLIDHLQKTFSFRCAGCKNANKNVVY